jgi:hypothetical protein
LANNQRDNLFRHHLPVHHETQQLFSSLANLNKRLDQTLTPGFCRLGLVYIHQAIMDGINGWVISNLNKHPHFPTLLIPRSAARRSGFLVQQRSSGGDYRCHDDAGRSYVEREVFRRSCSTEEGIGKKE